MVMRLPNAKREAVIKDAGWRLIGWDGAEDEKKRKNVTVECSRDKQSFRHLPYHGSAALWRFLLSHKGCRHGRAAPKAPKKCAACGQPLPPGDTP